MKFCKNHWDKLRQTITSKGGSDFVAADGHEAAKQLKDDLNGVPQTRKNFDPLMSAHNMILSNTLDFAKSVGANPMLIIVGDPKHPEWDCPICFLNFLSAEHDRVCTDPNCKKEKGMTFDDWIEHSANGAMEHLNTLPAE